MTLQEGDDSERKAAYLTFVDKRRLSAASNKAATPFECAIAATHPMQSACQPHLGPVARVKSASFPMVPRSSQDCSSWRNSVSEGAIREEDRLLPTRKKVPIMFFQEGRND